MGMRDLEQNLVEVARRDTKEKQAVPLDGLVDYIAQLLETIQQYMFEKARAFRDAHITKVDTWTDFEETLQQKGGFIAAHWDGTPETEDLIKQKTKATIRCIPLNNEPEAGVCVFSGKPSKERVLFAKAY